MITKRNEIPQEHNGLFCKTGTKQLNVAWVIFLFQNLMLSKMIVDNCISSIL